MNNAQYSPTLLLHNSMDKKQKVLPSKSPPLDFKTEDFIKKLQPLLSVTEVQPFSPGRICEMVLQRVDIIQVNRIQELIRASQLSVNLINFVLASCVKLLMDAYEEINSNVLGKSIGRVWELICSVLENIIIKIDNSQKQNLQNNNRSSVLLGSSLPFTDEFLNQVVETIIKLLLIDTIEVKGKKLQQFFASTADLQEKVQRLQKIAVVEGNNEIMKLYTLILCLSPIRVEWIVILTNILERDKRTKKELHKNIYQLQKWIEKRTLTFEQILRLLELIKHPEPLLYFTEKMYLKPETHKRIVFDVSYQPLIPVILGELSSLSCSDARSQSTSSTPDESLLISFIIQKFCLQTPYLIQHVLTLYHTQTNKLVLQSIFKYIQYHLCRQISIKKMKLLLQFLKDQCKKDPDSQDLSSFKSNKILDVMMMVSKQHIQQQHVLEFTSTSNITLNKVSLSKENIVLFIEINRCEDRMRVITLEFTSKDKLHIMLMLNSTKQHTKREVFVLVQSTHQNTPPNTLLKQTVDYQRDNLRNEFLFVINISEGKLRLCVNSIYFEKPLVNIKPNSTMIENIQIGKYRNKKSADLDEIPSFKGRLKLFQVFEKSNVEHPAYVFPMFTEKLKHKLSDFIKAFQIDPAISMCKGERVFSNFKAARTQSILSMNKYSEERSDVRMSTLSSISQVVEQLESYDTFLYLMSQIDYKLGNQGTRLICEIFEIMRCIAVSDERGLFVKWILSRDEERELMGLSYFLMMIFRNTKSRESQELIALSFIRFIFCFEEARWNKSSTISFNYQLQEVEIIVRLLLNFEIWGSSGKAAQMRVLQQVERRLAKPKIKSIIKSCIIEQYRQWRLSRENPTSQKRPKSTNRILNSLLMGLILYNKGDEPKEKSNDCLNESSFSIATTSTKFKNEDEPAQNLDCVQFKIADLIQRIVLIFDGSNNPMDQEISDSMIKTILFYIIEHHHSNDQYKNKFAMFFLISLINSNIASETKYQKFFIKSSPPYYHEHHCLLIVLLIKTLPVDSGEILRTILETLKQLIFKIQSKCQKQEEKEIAKQATSRFIREALKGYQQHSTFSTEYLMCFFNWIIANRFEERHIDDLFRMVKRQSRSVEELEGLFGALEKMEKAHLRYFISNPHFHLLFRTVTNIDKNFQERALVLVNRFFARLHAFSVPQAHEFYNVFLATCHAYPFTQQPPFPKLQPYQDTTQVLSICQILTCSPKLQAFQNTNDIKQAIPQQLQHYGGTLAHYLIKCEMTLPLIQRLQSLPTLVPATTYYSIDNLVEYFAPDYLFAKLIHKSIPSTTQTQDIILSRLLAYAQKHKSHILANIRIFFPISCQISGFIDHLSKISVSESSNQNPMWSFIEELKKMYVELGNTVNEEFIKAERGECLMLELATSLLDSENYSIFKQKIKEHEDQAQSILSLVDNYSKKDLIWANKYYQISFYCTQSSNQTPNDKQNPDSIKKQLQVETSAAVSAVSAQEQLSAYNFSLAECEWKKIVNRNLHWSEKSVPKSAIYKIDLHECPSFYHLNIKVTKPDEKKKMFPRTYQEKPVEQRDLSLSLMRISIRGKTTTVGSSYSQEMSTTSATKKPSSSSQPLQTKASIKNRKYQSEYVTQRGVYFGKITFNSKDRQIQFRSCPESQKPQGRQYHLSTSKYHRLTGQKIKVIKINEHCSVFTRRYILRHTALEIFTKDKSFFFNLYRRKDRDDFINGLRGIEKILNRRKEFVNKEFTSKWESGEINNFQYLMWINRYSGRTYNDLSQFPVFPWVIANYKDLSFDKELRNLKLPMGKLNEDRFEGYKLRMAEGGFDEDEKFLYGTFYSNPTVLYNFFIRLQPFLTLHWDHQGQKIDHADRLFSGIQEQYSSATNNTSDVKELVPEFYYWPEFLRNRNQFDLGKKQKGERVNDVILPEWASSPEEFIFKMRITLESEKVTQNLHHWIDLVFGDKSAKRVALENNNLFHPLMYQMERSDDDKDKDIFTEFQDQNDIEVAQLTISQFGQVPQALFSKPHIKKNGRERMTLDGCHPSPPHFKDAVKLLPCSSGGAVVSKKCITFVNSFVFDEKSGKEYKLKQPGQASQGEFRYYSYCIINDLSHVYSELAAGRLTIYRGGKAQLLSQQINSITHVITKDFTLITSLRNKLCISKLSPDLSTIIHTQYLSGHHDKIYKIVINQGIDTLLSVDSDNLVLIHYLYSAKFLRAFELKLISDQEIKEVRIHDMGYFLFLTSHSRILIYSYLGELLLETDFVYPNQNESITNVRFQSQYHPIILLSSTKGYIYKVSWLHMMKQKAKFPYRQYVLQKARDILHTCSDYPYNDQNLTGRTLKKDQESDREIIDFFIIKGLYENNTQKMTYSLMALFRSGHLRVFREMRILNINLGNNYLFQKMISSKK